MLSRFLFIFFLLGNLLARDVLAIETQPNVILLMLDGVRWQEFFHGPDPLIDPYVEGVSPFRPLLDFGRNSFVYGDLKKGHVARVSNLPVLSLPAYQSIMAGKMTACRSNSCNRIEVETLQERLLRELSLKKTEVATVASWPKIALSAEKEEGRTFVNAGIQENLITGDDPATIALNEKQRKDTPPWDARKDDYTFAQAMSVLKFQKPRFLFVSLNDADEFGHAGKYAHEQYIAAQLASTSPFFIQPLAQESVFALGCAI